MAVHSVSVLRTMSNTSQHINYLLKREKLLGEVIANILQKKSANTVGLTTFIATRWTVGAISFQIVLENYEALLQLWEECLQGDPRSDLDVRRRIIGCREQMS